MNRPVLHFFGLALSFALVLAGGVVYGLMVDRDQSAKATSALAKVLSSLPEQAGGWVLAENSEIDDRTLAILECEGYLSRTYVYQPTGEFVKVAVLLGPHGPMSVHTPEICYSSREYKIETDREATSVETRDNAADKFWSVTLRSRDLQARRLRVYYAWTYDGVWEAATNPRVTYSGKPYLFKLQIAGPIPQADDSPTADPCSRFLREFAPQLRQRLFSQNVAAE